MLSIKFIEQRHANEDLNDVHVLAEVNGVLDKDSYCSFYEPDHPYISIKNENAINSIKRATIKELERFLTDLSFPYESKHWTDKMVITIFCRGHKQSRNPEIRIKLPLDDYKNWSKPWSIATFGKELHSRVVAHGFPSLTFEESFDFVLDDSFVLTMQLNDYDAQLGDGIDTLIRLTETFIKEANALLLESLKNEVVATAFQFPEEIKTACKQYLIYFAQFLADLGIEAEAEVQEKSGKTLFTVTPKNKGEGLERIREALETYLNAPSDDSFDIQVMTQSDVAVGQWQGNVYHLKSQLAFSQSMLQMKEATIEALQLTIFRYKEMLELQAPKPAESEDVVRGIVSVKKYEGKGFSIDLPEILRRLKRKF